MKKLERKKYQLFETNLAQINNNSNENENLTMPPKIQLVELGSNVLGSPGAQVLTSNVQEKRCDIEKVNSGNVSRETSMSSKSVTKGSDFSETSKKNKDNSMDAMVSMPQVKGIQGE